MIHESDSIPSSKRKGALRSPKNERLLQAETGRDKKVKRLDDFRQGHLFLGESMGSDQAADLTSADQGIPY